MLPSPKFQSYETIPTSSVEPEPSSEIGPPVVPLEQTGQLSGLVESLRLYFDHDHFARDMELSGDIFTAEIDGQVHVFWSR